MNTVATRALLVFGGDAAARLFNFLAIVHFGRVLASRHFGYVIIGMTVLQYAALAADLGLSTVGMRETARPPAERRFSFDTILALRFILAIVVLVLYEFVLLAGFRSHPSYPVLALYGLSVLPAALLIEWYYQGKKVLAPVAVSRLAGGVVYLALVYTLVHTPEDTAVVPVAFGIGTLISASMLLVDKSFRAQSGDMAEQKPDSLFRGASALLQQSASVSAGSLFTQTVQLVPPLAAGWLLSASDAGHYGAAMKLLALALMLDRVFNILFLPAVARLWSSDRERLHAIIRTALRVVTTVGFSVSAVFSIVADSLMLRVFGAEFASAGPVLAVLSCFFALTMLNSVFTFSLIGAGHDRDYLTAGMWGGALSALLIIAGTAAGGVIGTAAAVVASEAVIVLLTWRAFRRHFDVRWVRGTLSAAALAVVFAVVCSALGLREWWLAPVLWCIFIGLSLLFRLISQHDLRTVLQR